MNRYLFHFAEKYHSRGYSVIPLEGKIPPAGFSWKPFQGQRAGMDEIRHWFGEHSNYNLAIVTGGVSGLVVVDCDSKPSTTWWRKNRPVTPQAVTTGRGGSHFYYRANCEVDLRNRARVLGQDIDLRATGGYVVAPPSIHPETGRAYMWEPRGYFNADELPVFDPSWVVGRQKVFQPSQRRASFGRVRDPIAYISRIQAVAHSGGHNATFRVACILREAGLCEEEALTELVHWNSKHALPPWTEAELLHKIQSAYSRDVAP